MSIAGDRAGQDGVPHFIVGACSHLCPSVLLNFAVGQTGPTEPS